MATHWTRWTFDIQMDAARIRTWQDVAPHVRQGFPKLFATDVASVHITTEIHPARPPMCRIVAELPVRYDAQQKAEVQRAIGESFVPFVFGPRAKLAEMRSTLILKCDPVQIGVSASVLH